MDSEQIKTYFAVVVPSGSTCCCRRQRHFAEDCGHKHRTEAAAEKCRESLLGWSNGNCSATWYRSRVVEFDRQSESEIIDLADGDRATAIELCTC
jgi:hypothetical protein